MAAGEQGLWHGRAHPHRSAGLRSMAGMNFFAERIAARLAVGEGWSARLKQNKDQHRCSGQSRKHQ
jgi:hypothetical protein